MAKQQPTYAELVKQRNEIEAQIREMATTARQEFYDRIVAEADALDIELEELFGPRAKKGRGPNKKGSTGKSDTVVKYRDKDDPSLTWSGKGQPSKWLREHVAAGRDREDYRVD